MNKKILIFSIIFLILLSTNVLADYTELRPSADGYSNQWDLTGASSRWEATSDNSDSSYVSETGAEGTYQAFELIDVPTGSTIEAVQMIWKCDADGTKGPEKIDSFWRVGGVNYIDQDALGIDRNGFANYTGINKTDSPANPGSSWTVDEVNTMEAVIMTDILGTGETISCSEVYVNVWYSEAVACGGSISNTTIEFPDAGPGDSIEPIVQSSSGTLREAINVSITQGTNCKVGIYAQTWYNDTSDHSFNVTEYEKYTVNPAGDIDWESITTYVPYEEANIVYPATCSGQDAPFNCSFYFNLTIPSGQFPSDYNKTVVFRITEV